MVTRGLVGVLCVALGGIGCSDPDTTPPTVTLTTPGDGASDVPLTTSILVEFSEPMAVDGLLGAGFSVATPGGDLVAGERDTAAGSTVELTPQAVLIDELTYTGTLTTAVTDRPGNHLEEPFTWAFTTRPRLWTSPSPVAASDSGDAQFPRVAIADDGSAMVVWRQADASFIDHIWAMRYAPDTGWGAAARVDTSDGFALAHRVGVDASGNAIAVWCQSDGTRDSIWASRFTIAAGWATPQTLETSDDDACAVELAVAPSGTALAVWEQSDTVWAAAYTGSAWQSAESLDDQGSEHSRPHVAVNDTNGVVVWHHYDGARLNVWAKRYAPQAGFGDVELVENEDSIDVGQGRVAINAAGHAVIVWSQDNGSWDDVWASTSTAESSWTAPQLLEDGEGSARFPQVGVDAQGNAVVVWQQFDGSRINVWANHYRVASGWATAELVEQYDDGNAELPRVAVTPSGQAVVAWYETTGMRMSVWTRRFVIGAGWNDAYALAQDNAAPASYPDVAVHPDGTSLAVWHQQTDDYDVVLSWRE